MDNIKKFEDFLDRMQGLLDNAKKQGHIIVRVEDLENAFPELKESEDERIRKDIIRCLKYSGIKLDRPINPHVRTTMEDALAWLEKQGEKSIIIDIDKMVLKYSQTMDGDFGLPVNCQIRAYRQGINDALHLSLNLEKQGKKEPNKMPIWKHWKDGIAGNGDGKLIYLIKYGNTYSLSSCLSFECDYILLSDLDKCEQKPFDYENATIVQKDFAPKAEPKFKVGDIIIKSQNSDINKFGKFKITGIKDGRYWYNEFIICEISEQDEWELDRIEPRFKIGDFVVNDYCMGKVIELTNDAYLLDTGQGIPFSCEHNAHLWTIQDAKDGDVLVDNYGNVVIYQEPSTKLMYHSYCYGNHKCFIDMGGSHEIVGSYPATQEQRDLLFQKIQEAGYEWDSEKKELKEIDQKDILDNTTIDDTEDGLIADTIKYKKQKH